MTPVEFKRNTFRKNVRFSIDNLLYDLITLQREANKYSGFTSKQTLDYVQSLYEKKLIIYPRVDSIYFQKIC
ncbi:MAG: DNA topoisomerase [Tissierellia bacterium]|nr:DNA topoisomerase [Tissierellia bacterium]